MRRLLHISLGLYFPLLLAAVAVLYLNFRDDILTQPLFLACFFLWLGDGLIAMAAGIANLRRVLLRIFSPAESCSLASLAILASALGALPTFIIVELGYKLILFLRSF
jgi:hypothetical protein